MNKAHNDRFAIFLLFISIAFLISGAVFYYGAAELIHRSITLLETECVKLNVTWWPS